ncbi:MAG: ParB/RepB/Spo0J family partition protein [Treponema sp.]|jgi:ParB family chromosome partitioning protein|nr:ParB/RepB/Spo0J family partition protein [Treponema sp.]
MAKLSVPGKAGFNAGKTYMAKSVPISAIVIDPNISAIFSVSDKRQHKIAERIREFGYDKSQPVTLWNNIIVDGHTRLAAAKAAGLDEIPAVEMEFDTYEDALLYSFERQSIRRNLTSAEIMAAASMLTSKTLKERNGTGRSAEILAERLGVSPSLIYKARKMLKEAPEEEIRAIQRGEKSIRAGYGTVKATTPATVAKEAERASLVSNVTQTVRFLLSAVVLLTESGESRAAELLINHFLRKKERPEFFQILPEQTRKILEK